MAFVEKTGKNVDEAIAEALKELNITADQADIEVLDEGRKGIFGFGRKDAKVRVTVKEVTVAEESAPAEKTVSEAAEAAVQAVKEAANIAVDTAVKKAEAVKADASAAVEDLSQKAAEAKDNAVDSAISTLESLKSERPAREARKYVVNDEAIIAAKEFFAKSFHCYEN